MVRGMISMRNVVFVLTGALWIGICIACPAANAQDKTAQPADNVVRGVNPPPPPTPPDSSPRQGMHDTPAVPPITSMISLAEFGTVADGKADDTAAVRKAIRAAVDRGKVLFVPAGTYRITSTLKLAGLRGMFCEGYLHGGFVYEGEGYCLDMRGAVYGCYYNLMVTCKPGPDGKYHNSAILHGNSDSVAPTETARGNDGKSDADRAAGNYFVGLVTIGGQIGLNLDGGCWINTFYQPRICDADVGIYLGMAANAIDFVSPILLSNRVGVQVAGSCYGVKFLGGLNEESSQKAFYFTGPGEKVNILISGMYFENAVNDLVIDGQVRNLTVSDCYIAGYHADKRPVLVHTNKYPYSGIVFNNNFIYLVHQNVYAQLNGATITVDNCFKFDPTTIRDGTVRTLVYKEQKVPAGAP